MTHDLNRDSLPLVDIVIPVFNADRHLSETLNTVNAQDYPNINIYAVDDCSTDHSAEILRAYKSKYPFFIVRHERNRGLSAARNSGISRGHGHFIAILDADDLWSTDKISKQVSAFLDGPDSIGVISSYFQVIDRDGNMPDNTIYSYCKDIEPHSRQVLVGGNLVSGGSAAMIRRDCFATCGGFDESLTACEDWEMWYRIACNYSIKIITYPLVLVRRYPESMQGDTPRMLRNRLEVLKRFIYDQQCASFAKTLYRKECIRCFSYLSLNPQTSASNAIDELKSLGIRPDQADYSLWSKAYNWYRITAVWLSLWGQLERRFEIRRRAKENKFLSRLFRASRWRLLTLKTKIFTK